MDGFDQVVYFNQSQDTYDAGYTLAPLAAHQYPNIMEYTSVATTVTSTAALA